MSDAGQPSVGHPTPAASSSPASQRTDDPVPPWPAARLQRAEQVTDRPFVAISMVTLLILAACSSAAPSTASLAPTEAPSPTTTATTSPPASTSPDVTVAPTSTDDGTGLAECDAGDMPDLDAGWAFLEGADGTFGVAYPDDWEDLSGDGAFTASTLLDEQTFAELGLGADATVESDFVRSPTGVPNLSVFHFSGVESSTAEIHQREVARYGELDDIEQILDPSLEACIGGTTASGLSLEFISSDANSYYQQNLFVVRNGELYVVQWLDHIDPDLDVLADILTTWGWMGEFGEPGGTGGIAEASMASEVDESADAPDPSTFVTGFTTDAPAIFVVFRADQGAEGTVNLTWLIEDEVAFEATLGVAADTTWAWGSITPPSSGWEPGSYEVQLELNGDVEIVRFTVEAAP
ncbi:MAG: hypothetical protein ACRDGB_07280 [Candidatus Limnocylindria bacterium]